MRSDKSSWRQATFQYEERKKNGQNEQNALQFIGLARSSPRFKRHYAATDSRWNIQRRVFRSHAAVLAPRMKRGLFWIRWPVVWMRESGGSPNKIWSSEFHWSPTKGHRAVLAPRRVITSCVEWLPQLDNCSTLGEATIHPSGQPTYLERERNVSKDTTAQQSGQCRSAPSRGSSHRSTGTDFMTFPALSVRRTLYA